MPYNPLAQAELDQQRAEQATASATPEAQQAAAEHSLRRQQSYESSPSHQTAVANAAAREAQKAQRTAQEEHYRAQGIPTWTGADGNLYPDTRKITDQAAKDQEKAAKDQAAASKAAAALAAKQQRAEAIRSGRKTALNPVDGTPIYLESEQQLEARRATAAEKLRQSQLDDQIKAAEAEYGATAAQNTAQGLKPLGETARKALGGDPLDKDKPGILSEAKQEARQRLLEHYQALSAQKSGTDDWIPYNEAATPAATAAQQHLARLQATDADLTDEDLATLSGNDATKPLAAKIQNIQGILSKDDELQKAQAAHALRLADLKLRRDAPEQWAESVRARRAAMSPEELQKELEASAADLDSRAATLQQQATSLNEQVSQHTQKLDALSQQAAQRRSQGIAAGDLVSYTSPDGTVEHWPRDLAAQRESIVARLQDTQSQQQSDWAALKAQLQQYEQDATLHNEGSNLLKGTQSAQAQQQKQSDIDTLRFTPGHEQTAQEVAALDSEAANRMADLNTVWEGNPPPEAVQAINQDIANRRQAALGLGESRRLAGIAAADDLKQFSQYDKEGNEHSQTEINQRRAAIGQNLSQALGITPEAADHLISDAQAQDWTPPRLPVSKGLLADTVEGGAKWLVESVESLYKPAKAEEQTRILSSGGIAVNPSITKEQDYRKAVEDSKASPEAKAEALARYPAVREQAGQKVLDGIHEIGSIYGPDTIADYTSTLKNKPKDVSEAEWAMRFTENLKAEARHGILNTLKSVGWEAWQSFNQGFVDQRAMASGLSAGALPNGLGSETMMKDAQWANRKASAIDTTLEIGGDQSTNPIAAGLSHQAPRFIGSLIGPGIAAKGAGGALSIFAKSKLGAKLLPSVAALIAKTAAPARAATSVDRISKAIKAGKLTVAEADAHVAKSLLSASSIAAPTAAQTVQAVKALTRAGIVGAGAAGGAQTYGAQITDIYTALKAQHPEMSHAEALRAAQVPSLLSAGVTAMLTVLVPGGSDRFLARPAVAKELFKKQFTSQLQRLGYMGKEFLKGGGQEFIEEAPDELFSQYQAGVASNPDDPSAGVKAVAAYFDNLASLAVGVGVLGGVPGSITAHSKSSIQRPAGPTQTALLPETQAAAEAAIQNHRHLDATGVEIPEITQRTQTRAALALATARGGDLADATEKQLNAAGWTRRDSQGRDLPSGKYTRLKDYTGPNVLNIDTTGLAHVDPQYLAALQANLPAVAAAIPNEATRPPSNEPQPTTVNNSQPQPTPPAGTTPAGQTPASGPRPNANPATVQDSPVQGAESSPSGTPPPPSGTPVSSGPPVSNRGIPAPSGSGSDTSGIPLPTIPLSKNSSTESPTTVPSVEKSIADWLVDRHMPDAEAAAAAQAITSHPDMAGKDYDHFTRQITARDALLQSLGITGSPSKKQAAQNPLRFKSSEGSAVTSDRSGSGQLETSNFKPSTSPSLPPSVQSALDDSIPGTPSPEVFEAIKKAVQAKELTDQAATSLVAQQTAAPDHTTLRQSLENKLGWNTPRANTAAALHFGDKSQSPIPLAAAERTTPPEGSADAPVRSEGSADTPVRSGNSPSTLTQNNDYARAKLASLSRISDPTQKTWARQFLALFEESFARHHLLYDAIATGPAARKHLDGQFTAVVAIGGQITRLIDLDAMVAQFSHIASPAAAVRATGIEEDVHALVLQLARKNPKKYGYPALIKQWQSLPPALQQTVWQAYHAAQATPISHLPSAISSLSESQQWHLMNEFLRMLVQDKHFAGQITEAVDASPSLVQWVKDLLKDLGNILRTLLKSAPPALQSDLQSMVDELGLRLKDIESASATSTARLESIPTLADTQGVTQQALTTLLRNSQGILSPDALARIWDQLDPALHSRVFNHFKTPNFPPSIDGSGSQSLRPFAANPPVSTRRAPKHELMQELLTLLLTDPAAAQSLLDTPPKTPTLLNKLVSSLFTLQRVLETPANTPASSPPLAALHAQILRLLASLSSTRFVQSLPPAVTQLVTTGPAPIAAKALVARSASSDSDSGIPLPTIPLPKNSGTESTPPAPAPEPLHPRAADFLAAIEAAEKDHSDAALDADQSKLRAKLRLQEVASTRTRFFLRDNAAREQYLATQAGRQDVDKATALQDLALGRIGARRPASAWRTLGLTERRRLARLGIGVDQYPSTDQGGYPYSLSRIEAAELLLEFSLAGTPEHQMAQEELDWMRQQPADYQTALDPLSPAYVERDYVIIKQSALDDLALSYPHTTALIHPEWQIRQSYGLRVDARLASGRNSPGSAVPASAASGTPATPQQPELPSRQGEGVSRPPQNSGSSIPLPTLPLSKNSATESTQRPTKLPTFDVPVKGEGTITATFPDTASREAFQFKHDLARSRKLPSGSERTKLETSLSTLKARFMADLGLGDDAVTTKLAAYHEHVVAAAAEHAAKNRIGGITAPQFEAFSGGRSAPSTKSLPAPMGGDLISDLARYGIGRISSTVQPGKAGDMDWFKSVTDGTAGPHKQTALILAVKAADAGELTTPLARRIWLAGTAGLGLTPAQARWERPGHVLAPNGMPIDAAASTLSSQQADGSGTPYQFESGDALGLAILEALDSRIAAKGQSADPTLAAESDAQEQSRNFATLISGNQDSGQSMTGAEIAAALDPDSSAENTLKLGTAWFTVDSSDDTGLHLTASGPDADLYGQQTLAPDQNYPVTQINDRSLSDTPATRSNNAERATSQSPESLEAQRSALPTDQRDIFQRRALEAIHRELPPEQLATPQDIAELQRDYQESVAAGESLDESTPDLDLDDDIADSADAYLDGEPLPASSRSPLSTLAESDIQGYLDLPDVAVPSNKQPTAKRAIRAAASASTTAYPLSSTGGDSGNRGRLDALRERAQRDWKALVGKDAAALREAFKDKDSFSTLLHDFISRDVPSFDIRGAIIEHPADFAAFNLATRSPYFESLKIAILDSANQVVHSQIVHVGGLNEAIADPKVVAGIIASARLQHPKTKFGGWMIAHNHPSGDPSPSEADRRVTRRFRDMGESLGLPMLDHVITNGQKYFSFREHGLVGGELIDESIDERSARNTKPKLPILPTPERPFPDAVADWEAIPSGTSGVLSSPFQTFSYLDALRTADPDHYHVLYLDTKSGLRAVERLPTSLTTAQIFQRIVLGSAREDAYSFAFGFPANRNPDSGNTVAENRDHVPVAHQHRIVSALREKSRAIGLGFADAMTHSSTAYFSFTEHGLMESPALGAAPRTVEHVEPGFYSALAEAIRAKMPARSTPATVVGILKNAGIKTEELKWTGILPWLQQQAQDGPITQQQVLDYLANEGAVHLQEVRLGGSQTNLEDANRAVIAQAKAEGMTQSGAEDYALTAARGDLSPSQQSFLSPAMRPLVARLRASYEARASEYAAGQSQPKYSQYQLPGGENYREVVLSLPEKPEPTKGYYIAKSGGYFTVYDGRKGVGQFETMEAAQSFLRNKLGPNLTKQNYTSSHFPDIPNYVAHMRLNDRTDAEGKDGTLIEEIQSDRHQAGREKGYREDAPTREETIAKRIVQIPDTAGKLAGQWAFLNDEGRFQSPFENSKEAAIVSHEQDIRSAWLVQDVGRIPDAPFRTSWPLQMFKRALAEAVASGKQWIGWTTGDTQADRYKLSNQVDSIAVWQNGVRYGFEAFKDKKVVTNKNGLTDSELADFIGKDLASKAVQDLEAKRKVHIYSGDDLNVGGHGMRGFYDTILPKEIGKYVKQWGTGVAKGRIPSISDQYAGTPYASAIDQPGPEIWRIDITPQMRAGVEAGQALFAAPRRAYESMTFDPPFHTPFGDILSYDWMNQPVGGLSSQRTSDWSRARTNPATGRDIVHHFKVQKPDGIHTVSLETALGQLTEPQRHKLQSLIKSEQRRREEAAAGQMTLFAAQRTPILEAIDRIQDWYSSDQGAIGLEYLPQDLQQKIESDPRWLWLDSHDVTEDLPEPNWFPEPYSRYAILSHELTAKAAAEENENAPALTPAEEKKLTEVGQKLLDWEIDDGPKDHIIESYKKEIEERMESTIEAIEATGRWEWTKENYFEATDEDPTQVLYAAPRVTDPPFSTQESKTLENTRIHAIDTYLHGKRRPIADTPPADQAGSSRAQLQALLQHARRSQRPSGPPAADENARIAEARRHDKTLLINWARNAGVLLSEYPDRYPLNSPQDKGGSEHHVFPDASNRWVKITKGDGSSFGYQPLDEGKDDEWMISKAPADLLSYLEKLALHNHVFHDDIILHGVVADPLGKVALIISQPHYKGTFAGVYTAIKPAMEAAGFVRVEPPSARKEEPSAYYRPSDNVAVIDLHSENAILEDNGTFLRVFDNIMLHPTGALRATFERLAAKRQALPAAQRVATAAAETDPNPSDAQKAAGNYTKGKVTLHGLRLSIENPRGSVRSGTDATGKPWSVTMPHHYGYFLGTEGKDGDHVDFFLGPNPDSQTVLIVNQRKIPKDGSAGTPARSGSGSGQLQTSNFKPSTSSEFDEHKVMLGFDSPAQAAKAYLAAYTPGWKGLQSAIPTTIPVLKEWLQNHDTTKPVTREGLARVAQSLPSGSDSDIPLRLHSLAENSGTESFLLPASHRVEQAAKALDKSVTGLGQAANLIPKAVGKTLAAITGTGQYIPGNAAMASLGTALGRADAAAAAKVGTTVADALQRVSGKDIRKAPDAVAAWLGKPDGLGAWTKSVVVDQLLPTALMPREWLALSHEMQRKTAFGAEKSNDLIRALSGNPRLSDLAYPKEFAENMMYREQLFDAMENKIPMSSLPPAMQALGTKLRAMLRETGLELVKQGVMHPDTFEELQANGWMPRYMLEEAMESGGSVLAAFKLGVKDLMQQRSTAFHIVDTTRKGKDGQYLTVNRKEGGRNAWRFRDAATRDAFYSDFSRRQALDMLQDTHGNTKELQTMMATLDGQQRREIRAQIKLLTRADMDSTQKLSPALAGMVKQAIEHQKSIYRKEAPFDPPKLIKDPVYSIARYILAQTHNAATMELLNETAKNKDWTSNVSLQGFTEIPDNDRFGPLAGKFVQKDIAQQILDKLDVPNAALRFYDAVLRKWKSGKLVWNPGSHIRDAVGNTVFAYLGGSNIANPGNWPYYRQALELMRGSADTPVRSGSGSTTYAELLEHGVLGGDAYSSLVRKRLKGLLPDAKTVENFNPGLIQRFFLDFGSKFHGTHEQLAEYRRMPDDFYKIAAYLKAKATFASDPAISHLPSAISAAAAAHVRKWFPYYDRLGGSATTRAAGRFVNPFLSFFRESTRILATAAVERPIALAAALAFPAAISALSAMLLGLDDRDRDEISKDLAGRGKGILGLSSLHLFSMLLPVRSSQGQVQQFDISAIMPFADLLGQKIVPLEEKENAWQTFWRQTAAAGPIGNLGVSWITNRDLFSGRHLTEADMSTPEMLRAYTQHAAGVALPPLAPDLAALVGIGDGGALARSGQRQTNKTLQTYDTTQTVIRSIFGMNVKSAAPNIYRQADDFRKAHGYDAQPDFDYGTTATSRAKRALVQQLAQDKPNPTAIKNLVKRLKDMGVPLDTPGAITKVLKIIDPASIIGGSRKQNLTAEDARQRFRQSLPPESRALYEASIQEYRKIQQRAPLLLRAAQ